MVWRIEYILIYAILLVSTLGLFYRYFRSRMTNGKNKVALDDGWQSYKQYIRAQKAGFNSPEDYIKSVNAGFLNKNAQQLLYSSGFNTVDSMVMYCRNVRSNINYFLESDADIMNRELINDIKTLQELSNLENHFQPYFIEINQFMAEINTLLSIQTNLLKLFNTEGVLFTTFRRAQLENQKLLCKNIQSKLINIRKNLNSEFKQKKNWFNQWQTYMSTMWITSNKKEISLKNISNVISATLDDEEYRLLNLLDGQKQKDSLEVNPFLDKELGFQIIMLMQ